MLRKTKNILIISIIYILGFNHAFSMQADVFVQSTVNRSSKILGEDFSKDKKCEVLTLSTLEKNSVSKIKAKLISYAS